jgi:hypothetical protein
MGTGASAMKSLNCTGRRRLQAIVKGSGSMSGTLLLLLICVSLQKLPGTVALANQSSPAKTGYVGSQVCSLCHPSIYESFSRTDMGRSMSEITPALLGKMTTADSVFDSKRNRHFEIFARDGNLYQSEYEMAANGKEVFRDTRKVEWIIGSGANGSGAIVKQGDYLFEAPLSFYAKPHRWALSPGYEFGDYGFNRPILPECIACHSGQPRPILQGNGRFQEPLFTELAIGCENCHGPGQSHVAAARMGSPLGSITNPAKLSPWLADNICMSCHQAGDARILRSGKTYRDFQPGAELDDTLSIFLAPFTPASAPKDDLLEHYLSMRLSKCYLKSGGGMGCIRCHDPHVQPTRQEAPAYFREKCLACHTEKSCALPLALRQHQNPPDDCAGCHMPKRNVAVISHSVLTNHRIVSEAEEPFPDAAFRMTTPQLPDLVHLSANPAKPSASSLQTRLQAYGQIMLARPEYRIRYWAVAKQLGATEPQNVLVLEALADQALQENNAKSSALALRYLEDVIRLGARTPVDFEELAKLLIAANRQSEAVDVLQQGIRFDPYDAEMYHLSATIYVALNKMQEACEVAAQASQKFPQDDGFRSLTKSCANAPGGPGK